MPVQVASGGSVRMKKGKPGTAHERAACAGGGVLRVEARRVPVAPRRRGLWDAPSG